MRKRVKKGIPGKKKINVRLCRELLHSSARGEVERVRELLQKPRVDVHFFRASDWKGPRTALVIACENGHENVVRLLLEHGGRTEEELEWCLLDAASMGRIVIVKVLLEKGVNPAAKDNTAISYASRAGHDEVVRLLLNDPRVVAGDEAIVDASERGHYDVVKLLLNDPRVDPAKNNNRAVALAARNGQTETLRVLLADPRVDGAPAILHSRACAVHVLLEDERCGIHVNRAEFLKNHKREMDRFDELVQERNARITAVSWVMKQIGQGWNDLREPTEERMQRLPLDWVGTKISPKIRLAV